MVQLPWSGKTYRIMKSSINIFFILCWVLFSCSEENDSQQISDKAFQNTIHNNYLDYVNPFIGTGGHGHTYPGVSMPFGMMQLSPDTRLEGWDGCGGYHFSDSIIFGFSHTHLSGTGVPDYADVLLMPTSGSLHLNNGSNGSQGYSSSFSHDQEKAEIGEYAVRLLDHNIDVRLACKTRSGIHHYEFLEKNQRNLVIDLEHRDQLLDSEFEVINDSIIQGKRISNAWASEQHLYFYMILSEPFEKLEQADSMQIFGLTFNEGINDLYVKIGISSVDMEGAKKNLTEEIPHWNFQRVIEENKSEWLKELNTIQILDEVKSKEKKEQLTIFYTALYHSYLNPNTFSDIDGRYRGMDLNIHNLPSKEDNQYTVFSLWDTYRATHPLFTITQPKRTNEFIRTMLRQYDDGGILPIWELSGNYTGCMIGYHGVPVIADAFVKGYEDFDVDKAVEAIIASADQDILGLSSYKKYGYVLADEEPESISKTLEYAYDDWSIYKVLDRIGHPRADEFRMRSLNYRNVFDPSTGFMRAKLNHSWFKPFDPFEVNYHYTEANAWHYSLYVPHDIQNHIELMGGSAVYENHLDSLFSSKSETSGREQVDITGLIGQYAHGNEPSHHMSYLYNALGKPDKTQEKIREILQTQYFNAPDGLSGNEDCGQMSSWYVLSALGIYPVAPGSGDYDIGYPIFDKVDVYNGTQVIHIERESISIGEGYIHGVTLNGNQYSKTSISHEDLIGSDLKFFLSSEPSDWGKNPSEIAHVEGNQGVCVPYFESESMAFKNTMDISLGSVDQAVIRFTMDGTPVHERSPRYRYPMKISESKEFRARAFKNGMASPEIKAVFKKIDGNMKIDVLSNYANQYAAGGDMALIDRLEGGNNYRTGHWQGYREDLSVIIDLGEVKKINEVSAGFLQDIKSWIWYPTEMRVFTSMDSTNFTLAGVHTNEFSDKEYGGMNSKFQVSNLELETRYIKVMAKNYGVCPDWHLGAGGETWLFVDEISIK